METVFEEGMEVYDEVFFPQSKGRVVKVENLRVVVCFACDDSKVEASYTKSGRLVTTHERTKPTLSTSHYGLNGFVQKNRITYEKAAEWVDKNVKSRVVYADEIYIDEEHENAFEALKKLIVLREFYNKGWRPNWVDRDSRKYAIVVKDNDIVCEEVYQIQAVLVFQNSAVRKQFFDEQWKLLEIAKPLL